MEKKNFVYFAIKYSSFLYYWNFSFLLQIYVDKGLGLAEVFEVVCTLETSGIECLLCVNVIPAVTLL